MLILLAVAQQTPVGQYLPVTEQEAFPKIAFRRHLRHKRHIPRSHAGLIARNVPQQGDAHMR